MTEQEFYEAAFQELHHIEKGTVTVELVRGDILLGHVEYLTSHGWRLKVFSDGDDWDYIESIISPSGERFELWPDKNAQDCEEKRRLRSYRPPPEQLQKVWGFLS